MSKATVPATYERCSTCTWIEFRSVAFAEPRYILNQPCDEHRKVTAP